MRWRILPRLSTYESTLVPGTVRSQCFLVIVDDLSLMPQCRKLVALLMKPRHSQLDLRSNTDVSSCKPDDTIDSSAKEFKKSQ